MLWRLLFVRRRSDGYEILIPWGDIARTMKLLNCLWAAGSLAIKISPQSRYMPNVTGRQAEAARLIQARPSRSPQQQTQDIHFPTGQRTELLYLQMQIIHLQ